MHTYLIGDLQGCCGDLQRLLDTLTFTAQDSLWCVGDLVNRGPASLATLRLLKSLGGRVQCVLGNHDLHLLAVAAGVRPANASDTLQAILSAPDRDELLTWLRHQPLAHLGECYGERLLMVHAGVLPSWSVADTLGYAAEVASLLRGPDYVDFLREMYGNTPAQWQPDLRGAARWRAIVNALTRLRFCRPTGEMDFATKEGAGSAPAGFLPWFEVPGRASADTTIVFGHWSTLGLRNVPGLIALDTGCVWGGQLTACRPNGDVTKRHFFQVSCAQHQRPS
ncbi:symmetrical bis(5'-nucleosyl)-tetraphosphatase [Parvibium lacunae]|uniref:Bis(5'-nucleosyl)-tetraphosphatase, symmetrical n=1 Tax=Parvibium lacunae TaxID=1888893 RepID=A0A368L4K6_9BURK|nr:symmetrical bis(5'-nucleosyl)-tetraphosphatase [Parvibium lacunae]RCS58518.1 symmetrical bis(5'-nucleosyl)-tetraphosphatase [Parvibium lacunae]